jgi:hypothetical protein
MRRSSRLATAFSGRVLVARKASGALTGSTREWCVMIALKAGEASHHRDPFDTFGPPELCTWRVGPNTCRFQTNEPRIARKLTQRSGAALVGYSVYGRYLRIFQERISPRSARKLVTRYLRGNGKVKESASHSIKATNARFLGQNATASASEPAGRVRTAEGWK